MAFDLITMIVIGVVADLLLTRFCAVVLGEYVMPASFISMLIVFIAVTRWNGYGLITIPFVALGVVFGGHLIGGYYEAVYWFETNWQFYISIVSGYLAFGANIFIYKRFETKKFVSDTMKLVILLIVDYVLFCAIQYLVYFLITIGNADSMIYSYRSASSNEIVNLSIRIKPLNGWIYNIFAFAVLIVGTIILRSQGVIVNAKQKLIDDKTNAKLDELDKKFSIEEVEDENSSNDSLSNEEESKME